MHKFFFRINSKIYTYHFTVVPLESSIKSYIRIFKNMYRYRSISMNSKVLTIGIVAALSALSGSFMLSGSAYASTVFIACAAPPDQIAAPSNGTTLNIAVINGGSITSTDVIADDAFGNSRGWDPNDANTVFTISGVSFDATPSSVISVSTNDFVNWNLCGANLVLPDFLQGKLADLKAIGNTTSQ